MGGPTGVKAQSYQSVDPQFWQWRVVVQGRWAHREHINKLESLAFLAGLKWRCRSRQQWGLRFLHPVDSSVTLSIMARGRTSSRNLQLTVARVAAICCACNVSPVLAYVRSHRNPADRPSRAASTCKKHVLKKQPDRAPLGGQRRAEP